MLFLTAMPLRGVNSLCDGAATDWGIMIGYGIAKLESADAAALLLPGRNGIGTIICRHFRILCVTEVCQVDLLVHALSTRIRACHDIGIRCVCLHPNDMDSVIAARFGSGILDLAGSGRRE